MKKKLKLKTQIILEWIVFILVAIFVLFGSVLLTIWITNSDMPTWLKVLLLR